ncbi:hypothetical protein FZEAL_2692 [Fusarium zealandicum]|uniref:Acetylserotonin methytransferase-like protein n=1 Tax=Fusarium zealandicum TaxID=1053134 RepID=A0A8H4XNL7_9HYPO|nr:hypothetical protein FZEAL_2692 [Fusarium zealandicum]
MSTPTPGGFSLFPSPSSSMPPAAKSQAPRPRRSESRERRAPTPHERRAATPQAMSPEISQPPQAVSPPRDERQTPQDRPHSPVESNPFRQQHNERPSPEHVHVQKPRPTVVIPGRSDTAFPQANTIIRSDSDRSRSSIAKPPLGESSAQPMRSIFPAYNPDVPLGQQNYVPTEVNPTQMPRAVISRQTYHEPQKTRNPPVRSPVISPLSSQSVKAAWPKRVPQEPPVVPTTSSTEQLKNLWKVANGWQASSSEGRVFCMKFTQEKDVPVYNLSSASQPFYNLRLDPTSASAYVTLTRHDPNKPYKAPKTDPSSSTSSIISGIVGQSSTSSNKTTDTKHWQEALVTTLEEETRKHPPNDGLVALLMPSPAAKMAIEKAQDASAVMLAERECARLVWDEDSSSHFLVHPALAAPFCVTIERSPAWSRVEYTLEHHESPQHLAKLTRDGTGGGWLEVDTGIASKIESYFIVDVAVAALLLVAAADEKNTPAMEVFEPPPPLLLTGKQEKRLSKMGKKEDKKRRKMESFEIDVESQDDSLAKAKSKDAEDKLPFLIRVVVKIAKGLFKCLIWILTIGFKCVGGVFKAAYSCVGSKY